jgi:hypothetical protein
MSGLIQSKIRIGIIIIVIGAVSGAFLVFQDRSQNTPPVIHDADWYVSHQTDMQQDSVRCQRNDTAIPVQRCENIRKAEEKLAPSAMQNVNGGK